METYKEIQHPLSDEDKIVLEELITREEKLNKGSLLFAVLFFAVIPVTVTFFLLGFLESIDSVLIISGLPALFGVYALFVNWGTRRSILFYKKMIDSGTKRAVKGFITKKRSWSQNERRNHQLQFGPHFFVYVTAKLLDQVQEGDEVIACYSITQEFRFLDKAGNYFVDSVEILSSIEENGIDLKRLRLEDNEYNDLIAKSSQNVEKFDFANVKSMPYEKEDRKKLIKRYIQFAAANVLGIILGFVLFPIGLILSIICLVLIVIMLVKAGFDFMLNKKLIRLQTLKEIKERKGKYITVLSRGKNKGPFTKTFDKSELDKYDLSVPVIVHHAPFSKKVIDISFKQK